MSMRNMMSMAAGLLLASAAWSTASAQSAAGPYGFGSPVSTAELAKYFAIPPDGRGLPPGSGTATAGAKVFAESCAACHGDKLQGNPEKGIGGDRLLGGRDTRDQSADQDRRKLLAVCDDAVRLCETRYAVSAPGSLSDDEVYAVVAYILSEAKIIKPTDTMDAKTLPMVAMPNKDGFIANSRPELELYR